MSYNAGNKMQGKRKVGEEEHGTKPDDGVQPYEDESKDNHIIGGTSNKQWSKRTLSGRF